ncbi:MAG TPA: hypothetical protein P5119_00480 [Candidatus Aminicenantes bacterium]|nr:hypothetical protein [Candidatus Aminicenantes bacterium]HRY63799.1 hypothetical protein [Candidatus Aminicenantes bacterium]HRZ70712.1 hypothetical protein [Candidatus Aminicenantes bacterium]
MSKLIIDVSDRSRNVYFDTSIYNRILDDSERERIIGLIKERGLIVIPSAVNLCELLMTSAANRKAGLIQTYNEIRNDFHPLKPFPWLLQESVEAVQQNMEELEIVYPININDETENICRELMAQSGGELEPYLQGARDYVQRMAQTTRLVDEVQYFAYLDTDSGQRVLLGLFDQLCRAMRLDCGLDEVRKITLITSLSMPWKYYLESYAYLFYRRAFPDRGYGRGSNPGPSDLDQCIYMFWPGHFVVEDPIFLTFLKRLSEIRTYPVKVMSYAEFRDFLSR